MLCNKNFGKIKWEEGARPMEDILIKVEEPLQDGQADLQGNKSYLPVFLDPRANNKFISEINLDNVKSEHISNLEFPRECKNNWTNNIGSFIKKEPNEDIQQYTNAKNQVNDRVIWEDNLKKSNDIGLKNKIKNNTRKTYS